MHWRVTSVLCLLCLWPLAAWAEEPGATASEVDVIARARALFSEGLKLADEGHPDEACERFEESYRLRPSSPGNLLNRGGCWERRGALLEAWRTFELARTEATKEPDVERRTRWLDAAQLRLHELDAQLSQVFILRSPTPGVEIEFDGTAIHPVQHLRALPGPHRVVARAQGYRDYVREFGSNVGETVVELPALERLPALSAAPAPLALPYPTAGSATPASGAAAAHVGVVAWAVLGGGAGLLSASLISGGIASAAERRLDERCAAPDPTTLERRCDPGLVGTKHEATRWAQATDWFLAGSALTLGTGVLLLVLDLRRSSLEPIPVAASCSALGCAVSATASF